MSVKRSSATHLILRIAPQLSCSRNPLNIRNSLIYYANRYRLFRFCLEKKLKLLALPLDEC